MRAHRAHVNTVRACDDALDQPFFAAPRTAWHQRHRPARMITSADGNGAVPMHDGVAHSSDVRENSACRGVVMRTYTSLFVALRIAADARVSLAAQDSSHDTRTAAPIHAGGACRRASTPSIRATAAAGAGPLHTTYSASLCLNTHRSSTSMCD